MQPRILGAEYRPDYEEKRMVKKGLTIDYRSKEGEGKRISLNLTGPDGIREVTGIFDHDVSDHIVDTFVFLWTP